MEKKKGRDEKMKTTRVSRQRNERKEKKLKEENKINALINERKTKIVSSKKITKEKGKKS